MEVRREYGVLLTEYDSDNNIIMYSYYLFDFIFFCFLPVGPFPFPHNPPRKLDETLQFLDWPPFPSQGLAERVPIFPRPPDEMYFFYPSL